MKILTLNNYRLRKMDYALSNSQDNPKLSNIALVPEVNKALLTWVKNNKNNSGVMIGGLALALYSKPRETVDIDILYLNETDIPDQVLGFKRIRKHSFQENQTHVEIELVTPKTLNIPNPLVKRVVDTAVDLEGIKVATKEALIALKLYGATNSLKREFKDMADVVAILETNPKIKINQKEWNLTDLQMQKLEDARLRAKS